MKVITPAFAHNNNDSLRTLSRRYADVLEEEFEPKPENLAQAHRQFVSQIPQHKLRRLRRAMINQRLVGKLFA